MSDDPIGYWNDEAGPKWVRAHDVLDPLLTPITDHLFDAIEIHSGARVIDVGCGSGSTTLEWARRVGPKGRVWGVDVSKPLIEHARTRCADVDQIEIHHGDAATFPFEPGWADLVTSRFGVMFFTHPPTAFKNLRHALGTKGRLAFVCWQSIQRNPWNTFIMQAFPEVAGAAPSPEDAPGPFSLCSSERIARLLDEAGFSQVSIEDFSTKLGLGETVDHALAGLTEVGPLARLLTEADKDEHPKLLERARVFLQEQYRAGPPALDAAVWLVQAEAPGST